jgi:hypothetical protein
MRLPRAARRQLADGRNARAQVTALAADAAANVATMARSVLLVP